MLYVIGPKWMQWSSGNNYWNRGAASRHTTAPISHIRRSPRSTRQVSYYSFSISLRVGDMSWPAHRAVSNLLEVACSVPGES